MTYKLRDIAKELRDRLHQDVQTREFNINDQAAKQRWIDDQKLIIKFDEWIAWADKRKITT